MTCKTESLLYLFLFLSPAGCAVPAGDALARSKNTIPLVTTREDGVADSQVVPIRLDGKEAWLAIDTGAPFTFLYSDPSGPEYVEDAGTIIIGCERWPVPGYRDEAIGVEMFQGRPIAGILGLDFFVKVPAEIDYPGGWLVRYLDGALPRADRSLPAVRLRGAERGRALVAVSLDGVTRTLMLDTGAHDTILVGEAESAGGDLVQVQTADGRRWDVEAEEALLCIPGDRPRAVPIMRAPKLDYIGPELRELNAEGLFGLTSLGLPPRDLRLREWRPAARPLGKRMSEQGLARELHLAWSRPLGGARGPRPQTIPA